MDGDGLGRRPQYDLDLIFRPRGAPPSFPARVDTGERIEDGEEHNDELKDEEGDYDDNKEVFEEDGESEEESQEAESELVSVSGEEDESDENDESYESSVAIEEDSEGSEAAEEAEFWEDYEDYQDKLAWQILRNITISRDQTQASSYNQEKLSALKETLQKGERSWSTFNWGDGRGIATGSNDGAIRIFDQDTGDCISELPGHHYSVNSIAWSADTSHLASSSDDRTIKIWDFNTGKCVLTLSRGQFSIHHAVAWSADGQLASGTARGEVIIWDLTTAQPGRTLKGHGGGVNTLVWSPDDTQIASGSEDKTIKIWDTKTGNCVSILDEHSEAVKQIAWSAVSNQIASGSYDEYIKVWDLEANKCIATLRGHRDWIRAVAWSPDGNLLASASDDRTVRIWDPDAGKCTLTLKGHRDWVRAVAWSPDGSQLASAGDDRAIRIWNPVSGDCLSTITGVRSGPNAVVYLVGPESGGPIRQNQALGGLKRPFTGFTASFDLYPQEEDSVDEEDSLLSDLDEFLLAGPHPTDSFGPSPSSPNLSTPFVHPPSKTSETLRPDLSITNQLHMDADSGASTPASGTAVSEMAGTSWEEMAQRLAQLETENKKLKAKPQTSKPTWQVFHMIKDDATTYLSEPSWGGDGRGNLRIRGNSPISDAKSYLDRRPEIAFAVYKFYNPEHQSAALKKARSEAAELPPPEPAGETIKLISNSMISAMEAFCQAQPGFHQDFPHWDIQNIQSPYLFRYHYRNNKIMDTLPTASKGLMKLLTEWIDGNYGELYTNIEEQFAKGCISSSSMPFFVRPGDVVVSKQDRTYEGYIATSWAQKVVPSYRDNDRLYRESERTKEKEDITETWKVEVWSYKYDGRFYRQNAQLDIVLNYKRDHPQVDIDKLNILPLNFVGEDIKKLLDRRGQVMWQCRVKDLVSYEDDKEGQLYGHVERFMIDYATYKQLHSDPQTLKKAFPHLHVKNRQEISAETMELDEPPGLPERLVFPNTIIGYNLRLKKWLDLKVDRIRDVSWNEDAFEHLVVDVETKILIRALVSSKLEADQGTDVIEGKGNGLIILLHGGPGTGKTFTAESVAEIAKKPLYRVTCGDIGTKPQEVEKYLESVLYLGKIWDCVVLLDEADVFLEQRTLMDLERNALVSVFLRVLEYYEGILILTSNRVGTFDEAFKSRIQLSLHYDALTKSQRSSIWKNFITRLKSMEESSGSQKLDDSGDASSSSVRNGRETKSRQALMSIDYAEVERHIEDLAKMKMNGRQIRNIITTARQLAKYEHTQMTVSHLRRVVKVSSKFDEYLKKVTGNTDEEAAREDGRR